MPKSNPDGHQEATPAAAAKKKNPAVAAKVHSTLAHIYADICAQPVFMEASSLRLMQTSIFSALERINGRAVDSDLLDFIFLFDEEEAGTSDLEVDGGIALIPIIRPITNLPANHFLIRYGIYDSYDQIRERFDEAQNRSDVTGIMYRIDSPGGMHAGLMDLIEDLRQARGKKPTVAMVDEEMFSAAYGIGSTADEIWITRSSAVGSIGTLLVHEEESLFLKSQGFTVTDITYGKKKAQFAYWKPLSDEAKADLQEMVDVAGKEFTEAVAKNLNTSFEMIKSLEAGIFEGQKAVNMGLADRIIKIQDALDEMKKQYGK